MNRKIIQIQSTGVVENSQTQCEMIVIALCDDGTLWKTTNRNMEDWVQLWNVPQGIVPSTQWGRK